MKSFRYRRVAGVACAFLWAAGSLVWAQDDATAGPTVAELRTQAERGEVRAMVELARRYDWGDAETEQDLAEARVWWEKAASRGDGYAAFELAKIWREGRGVVANPTEAFKWMRRAAEGGLTAAQVELGLMHANAEGTPKNLVQALACYVKAAEQSDPEGEYLAGIAYLEGRGTKKDEARGAQWLLKASNAGHEGASGKLWELRDADPELPEKLLAAAGPALKQLMTRAEAGEAKAEVELAETWQNGSDELLADSARALAWWEKAAAQGEPKAMTEMGRRYLVGEDGERDLAKADAWLQKAAAKKEAEAYFWLGAARDDHGDEPNPEEAAKYYRLGAEAGDATSQRRLGEKLEGGIGVVKNAKEALAWYVKAAEQGDPLAMMQAAMLASSPDAGVVDFALARKWAEAAARRNQMDASFVLENIDREEETAGLAREVPAHVPEAVRETFIEALRGDGWSQWQIATRYSEGKDGLPQDAAAFELWRQRAADTGWIEAQESLGLALTDPAAKQRDIEAGLKLLENAAAAGMSGARVRLAELLASGDGVPKNEARAVELLENEARSNRPDLMWRLRQMYVRGIDGAAPDEKKAVEWLMRASMAGHPEAKAEEAKIAAAKAAAAKAAEEEKFAEVERKLDADFAASTNIEAREKAVREYSRAIAQLDWGNGQNQGRISERVFRALIPKMQARVDEAGAYAMAVNSLAFDAAVMNRVLPANLISAIRAHGQQVSAAFNAKQQALGPIQSLIDPALKGDVAKQMQIGDYLMQQHAARDPEGALLWYKRAAAAGHAPARQKIAVANVEVMKNVRTLWQKGQASAAIESAKKVAETGDEDAMLFLGAAYVGGKSIPQDLEEAKKWFTAAKAAGSSRAQEGLDLIARGGQPATEDSFAAGMRAYEEKRFSDAVEAWQNAAEAGHPDATFNLGIMHERGEGVAKDNARALAWFERAAAKGAKNAEAAIARVKQNIPFERGFAAYQEKNFEAAAAAWREAAELGSTGAMYNLGVIHESGEGVARDLPQAMAWFEKAAAGEHQDAEASVARLKPKLVAWDVYQKGVAAEEEADFEEAFGLFEQAAAAGSSPAMMALGGLYEKGDGVDEDPRKAIEWYKKAAAQGEAAGEMMAEMLEQSLPMYDLMASQREMKRLRDQIDGVATAPAAEASTGPASGRTAKQLRKNAPWTPEEVRTALKDGANQRALSQAIKADKLEKTFTAVELRRLLNTSEGQRVEDFSPLSKVLHENVIPGAGAWTYEMAKAAVEARRAQVGRVAKMADSAELRAKAAAGDAGALLALYLIPAEQRTQGPIEVNHEDLIRRIEQQKYARGYWLIADGLKNNVDKTKNDPARRAELLFAGAEAGDPRAMRELAMEFIAPADTAVATNYAEAEYWMIEAAARAAEGTMEDIYYNPGRDVAFFYSFAKSTGGPVPWALSSADEPTLRWAREMIRRRGKLADVANVYLDAFELEPRTKGARAKLAALPSEVPLWSAAEVAKLETAAKGGDAEAALTLANGYASGRGVRQRDGKAVAYYEMAAAKGSVPAMRALAECYFKGLGAKKDGAKRLAWLEKAGEAGDASAWTAAAHLLHYGVQDPETAQDFPRAIALYQKAVAKGDGAAMHALGVMHQYGRGVPADTAKAAEWYRKAADAGERFSMVMLAEMLKNEKKFAEAAVWFGEAADAGEENGRFWQGQMLARAQDWAGAIPVLREAVAKNPKNGSAWLELGAALQDSGKTAEAKEPYRKVIELMGEAEGQGRLAKELLGEIEATGAAAGATSAPAKPVAASVPTSGKNGDQLWEAALQAAYQDNGREVVRLIQAAAEVGETASPWNRYRIALALVQGNYGVPKNEARARELLQSAAEAGFASAKLDYALALMQGALGFTPDEARGRALLAELVADADNANADAKYQIGMLLFHGKGVAADRTRGIGLVKTAAEWNVPPAQFEIGRALLMGMPELPADPARGVEFLTKAFKNGVPAAAAVLGEVYEKGIPGPAGGKPAIQADAREALTWYEQALKAGIQQVAPAVERLQLQLSGKGPRPAGK